MPFGWLLFLAVITLGIALSVTQIKYALALTRHGQRIGHSGTNPQLGSWVFVLTVVSFVWSIGTLGIGFLLGGFAMAVYATSWFNAN